MTVPLYHALPEAPSRSDRVLRDLIAHLTERAHALAGEIAVTEDPATGWALMPELDRLCGEIRLVRAMLAERS